ncbi:hypothetical protein CYMTET_18426 [Cymbomonas tetramitiformis]|uniref:Uncharacterized protein n=1 Tax=Cymbomonas tetramitiformis TaxID=36881 RepID=A0AAE0G8E5_9CHLO|nr:hypothetical protein CYMTET_18426 [Cymbomonas tetramitiformis]
MNIIDHANLRLRPAPPHARQFTLDLGLQKAPPRCLIARKRAVFRVEGHHLRLHKPFLLKLKALFGAGQHLRASECGPSGR